MWGTAVTVGPLSSLYSDHSGRVLDGGHGVRNLGWTHEGVTMAEKGGERHCMD